MEVDVATEHRDATAIAAHRDMCSTLCPKSVDDWRKGEEKDTLGIPGARAPTLPEHLAKGEMERPYGGISARLATQQEAMPKRASDLAAAKKETDNAICKVPPGNRLYNSMDDRIKFLQGRSAQPISEVYAEWNDEEAAPAHTVPPPPGLDAQKVVDAIVFVSSSRQGNGSTPGGGPGKGNTKQAPPQPKAKSLATPKPKTKAAAKPKAKAKAEPAEPSTHVSGGQRWRQRQGQTQDRE